MNRKPNTYGATPIRVYHDNNYVWFSDASEAMEYVKENWQEGSEMSARINGGGRAWEPIYIITGEGEIYVSPLYETIARNAPVHLGNVKEMV